MRGGDCVSAGAMSTDDLDPIVIAPHDRAIASADRAKLPRKLHCAKPLPEKPARPSLWSPHGETKLPVERCVVRDKDISFERLHDVCSDAVETLERS